MLKTLNYGCTRSTLNKIMDIWMVLEHYSTLSSIFSSVFGEMKTICLSPLYVSRENLDLHYIVSNIFFSLIFKYHIPNSIIVFLVL